MRKLHLVGLTTDRDGLIFTARKGSKSGGFIVPLDDNVLKAIAEAAGGSNGAPVEDLVAGGSEVGPRRLRSESALTPREMQARLRAGRSIEEVATEANVDTEWVARFAVPILAEQAQVVELARALVYAKPRLGESTQALGPSVLQNLSDRGVFLPDDVANAGWSAFQLHDSVWMVRFRYRARGRDQEAQWEIDVPTGRLRARNRHASDLGYVDPDRWRVAIEPNEIPAEAPATAPRRRAAKATATREPMAKAVATAKRLTAARKAAPARAAKASTAGGTGTAAKAASSRKASTVGGAGRAGAAAKAAKSPKAVARRSAAAKATPTRAAKAAGPQPSARAAKATAGRVSKGGRAAGTAKAAPAGKKGSPRTASGRPVAKRTTKAVPASDAGPMAGSGGVRMAVARVSTARVAASMATADREPWAAVVRRPPRPASAALPQPTENRRRPSPEPIAQLRRTEAVPVVRAFAPRPLPAPGEEPPAPRARKVTVPRPVFIAEDGPPPVSLPTPHRPTARPEPLPAERPKRRRLRSR